MREESEKERKKSDQSDNVMRWFSTVTGYRSTVVAFFLCPLPRPDSVWISNWDIFRTQRPAFSDHLEIFTRDLWLALVSSLHRHPPLPLLLLQPSPTHFHFSVAFIMSLVRAFYLISKVVAVTAIATRTRVTTMSTMRTQSPFCSLESWEEKSSRETATTRETERIVDW